MQLWPLQIIYILITTTTCWKLKFLLLLKLQVFDSFILKWFNYRVIPYQVTQRFPDDLLRFWWKNSQILLWGQNKNFPNLSSKFQVVFEIWLIEIWQPRPLLQVFTYTHAYFATLRDHILLFINAIVLKLANIINSCPVLQNLATRKCFKILFTG